MEARRHVHPMGGIVAAAALLALSAGPAGAAEKDASPPARKVFHGLARLGPKIRGEFGLWESTLLSRNEKGKTVTEKTVLEFPAELPILVDGKVALEDLASGDTALVLGREMEREVQSKVSKTGESQGGRDRQIQNVRVILAGRDVEANETYREGRDKSTQWFKTEVKSSSAGLWVKYKDHEYRVTLDRNPTILKRTRGERKLLKSGAMVLVKAEEKVADPEEKKAPAPEEVKKASVPEGSKAAEKLRLVCKLLVLVDPQLGKVYEAVLP